MAALEASAFNSLAPPTESNISTTIVDDPTLSACCQKDEIAAQLKSNKDQILRKHDRVGKVENQKVAIDKEVRGHDQNWSDTFGFLGVGSCRCCFDGTKSSYDKLSSLRLKMEMVAVEGILEKEFEGEDDILGNGARGKTPPHFNSDGDSDGDSDSDSDSEFDYLLDEPDSDLSAATAHQMMLQTIANQQELQYLRSLHAFGTSQQLPSLASLRKILSQQESFRRDGILSNSEDCVVLHVFDSCSDVAAGMDLAIEVGVAAHYKGTR